MFAPAHPISLVPERRSRQASLQAAPAFGGTIRANGVAREMPARDQHMEEHAMRWEYLVVEETLDSGALGKLGADGWELVAVVSPAHFVLHYFFKREARA